MAKICGIYKITSPENRIYIGQSVDVERRFDRYKYSGCKTQTRLSRSFKKHGVDAHKFEIIHQCEPEQLNELEVYYIELFQCFNTENGLNLRSGGGSSRMSDETKRFAYMRSGTCTNLKFSTNVSVPFLIYAVMLSLRFI